MLTTDNSALLIIDVQEKLFRVMAEAPALLQKTSQMIRGAQALKLPTVWAEQYPEGMGRTLPEIAELLQGQRPIPKRSFSCCQHEPLWQAMQAAGRKQWLLLGIEAHVCVYQTALDLMKRGFEVAVVADAVSSRTLENKHIGLERIRQAGGQIGSVELCLFELLQRAEGPAFKEILGIVK